MAVYRVSDPSTAPTGLSLFTHLARSGSTASTVSTVAAAVSVPFIAHRFFPGTSGLKKASAIPPSYAFRISSVQEDRVGLLTPGLTHIVSVLHPKNLVVVFCRSLGIQVLLMINVYMMQLLEHEQRCLEADERGEQAPNDAPPIPSFKPCFNRGLMLGCRELSVAIVRRIYEAVAVYRMGRSKADVLLRDAKSWIRNVLAFRHRLDPVTTRFVKYSSCLLHASALFYCAECTVGIFLHAIRAEKNVYKSRAEKTLTVVRGCAAQVIRCLVQWTCASLGGSLGSFFLPGVGTGLGVLAFDLAALTGVAHLVDQITGDV